MKIILDERDVAVLFRGDTVERGDVEIVLEALDYPYFQRVLQEAIDLEKARLEPKSAPPF